ncbi:MAG: HD family phosphohydrolase [Bdellovibrionales bacterium]
MDLKKKKNSKNNRSRYQDQSDQFLNWVNSLGFEKTFFGKIAYFLETSFKIRILSILFFFALALSFLITLELDPVYTGYQKGDIAAVDIRSPITFEMIDEPATKAKREQAENSVPPIFKFESDVYEETFDRIYAGFKEMRVRLEGLKWSRSEYKKDQQLKDFLVNKSDFEEMLGHQVTDRAFLFLSADRFRLSTANFLVDLLEPLVSLKIVDDLGPLTISKKEYIIISFNESANGEKKFGVSNLVDLEQVREGIKLPSKNRSKSFDANARISLTPLVKSLVSPNLLLMREESAVRRQKARDSVVKVNLSIKSGQVIVAEGSTFQPTHITILDHIRGLKQKKRTDLISLFMAILMVTLIVVMFSYNKRYSIFKLKIENRDIAAMLFICFIVVFLTKIGIFFNASSIFKDLGLVVSEDFFTYLTPMAAGPIMVALLLGRNELIWMFTIFNAIVVGVLMNMSFDYTVVALFGGLAAARGVHNFKARNDIYYAGLRVGLVQMVLIGILTFLTGGDQLWHNILWNSLAGLVSGIFTSFVAMILVPLMESAFNYTTDVRLLELSNLNHPLMKEMIVKAPGTYHHCIVVGTMCEAACEDIGANPLLAKVGAYYHDIGKSHHPEYFVENQKQGFNPHDQLSPNMSKTILVAHVKDGVEMGEKHKLGRPIIDIIQQHHGTSLIAYFYNKAKQKDADNAKNISEDDFRYPGPKPKFREAGVVMIADSIEAAARSLDEPTPVRLQNIVKNVIHNKFMDGQLENCNLTLRDLRLIEKSFIRTLLTIYHQRIDYPKEAGGQLSEIRPASSV